MIALPHDRAGVVHNLVKLGLLKGELYSICQLLSKASDAIMDCMTGANRFCMF